MTSVPKPLKLLRPHYQEIEAVYDKYEEGEIKVYTTVIPKGPYIEIGSIQGSPGRVILKGNFSSRKIRKMLPYT